MHAPLKLFPWNHNRFVRLSAIAVRFADVSLVRILRKEKAFEKCCDRAQLFCTNKTLSPVIRHLCTQKYRIHMFTMKAKTMSIDLQWANGSIWLQSETLWLNSSNFSSVLPRQGLLVVQWNRIEGEKRMIFFLLSLVWPVAVWQLIFEVSVISCAFSSSIACFIPHYGWNRNFFSWMHESERIERKREQTRNI